MYSTQNYAYTQFISVLLLYILGLLWIWNYAIAYEIGNVYQWTMFNYTINN